MFALLAAVATTIDEKVAAQRAASTTISVLMRIQRLVRETRGTPRTKAGQPDYSRENMWTSVVTMLISAATHA